MWLMTKNDKFILKFDVFFLCDLSRDQSADRNRYSFLCLLFCFVYFTLSHSDTLLKQFTQLMQKLYAPLCVAFKDLSSLETFLITAQFIFSPSAITNKLACLLHFPLQSDLQAVYIPILLLNSLFAVTPACSSQTYLYFVSLVKTRACSSHTGLYNTIAC